MKMVFVFGRLGHSKWFAPILYEALQRGQEVECWLDQHDISQTTKWYEFPNAEKLPFFESPGVTFRTFSSEDELESLATASPNSALIMFSVPKFKKPPGQTWAHVIGGFFDTIFWMSPQELNRFDIIFCNTNYWIEGCLRYYRLRGLLTESDPLTDALRKKLIPAGAVQYDHFRLCKREKFLEQINLTANERLVTLYAFEGMVTFWFQRIFLVPSLVARLFFVATLPLSYNFFFTRSGLKKIPLVTWKSIRDRLLYLKEALLSKSERDVLLATKAFAKKNGRKLLFKYRKKHNPKPHQSGISDRVIFEDTEYYPYTSAQSIVASDLVVTFFSSAVAECVYAGVPVVNIIPPARRLFVRDHYDLLFPFPSEAYGIAEEELFYNETPGGIFHFPGAVWCMTVNKFVENLPQLSMADFRIDQKARKEYLEKFVVPSLEGSSAERIVDHLIRAMKA